MKPLFKLIFIAAFLFLITGASAQNFKTDFYAAYVPLENEEYDQALATFLELDEKYEVQVSAPSLFKINLERKPVTNCAAQTACQETRPKPKGVRSGFWFNEIGLKGSRRPSSSDQLHIWNLNKAISTLHLVVVGWFAPARLRHKFGITSRRFQG